MAVTFAVGAVTGTVLTFEFGLLWPNFMGKFGAAFGIPFAIEGLFFFAEAIFIAIYIYGWKRLKPWPHFWTGVPIVIAGIGGVASVVAANSWMNEPGGLRSELGRQGRQRRSDRGDLQQRDALRDRAHARRRVPRRRVPRSRRCTRARTCAGAATAITGSASSSRSPSPPSPLRSRCSSVTRWPGGCTTTNRPSSPRIELVPKTSSDVPETLLGHLNSKGQVVGGFAIPGLASWLSDPATGTSTVVKGLDSVPASQRPTDAEVNVVHLAWDVMVGIGDPAVPAGRVVRAVVALPARQPEAEAVLVARRGRRRRVDPGARGRLGRHRGRSPTLDRLRLLQGETGGDAQPRRVGDVPDHRGALRRCRRDAGADPAADEPALARAARTGRDRDRGAVRPAGADPGRAGPPTSRSRSDDRCRGGGADGRHRRLRGVRWRRLRCRLLGPHRRRRRAR